MASLRIIAPEGLPIIAEGDSLAPAILLALAACGEHLAADDVVVVAQKIVSKSEGRQVSLASVTPTREAHALAERCGRDPRLIELILSESSAVLREREGLIIVEHRLGLVLANAGLDQSNVDQADPSALLLPRDPDRSARRIRDDLVEASGVDVAVVIIDSVGRAWRNGTIGTAIGVAGAPGLVDLRGTPDLYGRPLQSSQLGFADEIAAAASLMMGQADEARPVAILRGAPYRRRDGCARELVRPREMDLFR
jgi:coenzyme F420-0:L-glutamate ligase/coenzyme F420-1:gamma-L-glutamate ligase